MKEQANAKGNPIRDRRERLHPLLDGARDRDSNIISDLVAAVSELVVQELVEGEQADFLGGHCHYQRRGERQRGFRNRYEPRRIHTAQGPLSVQVPQVRGAGGPFRPVLMSFLGGNSDVPGRLVTEMNARGMSTRDIEDAFRDVTGELLISKSAVSEITSRLGADDQEFTPGTCRRSKPGTCSPTRSSNPCAARRRKRRCWWPGASLPTGASTCCCTWRWGTRRPQPAGPSSSATCSAAPCGCRPRSPPTGARPDQRDHRLLSCPRPDPLLVRQAGQHRLQVAR